MNQIAQILLDTKGKLTLSQSNSENIFSSNPEADKLCIENTFAFLLGCLAAQGMRASKIWEFPYLLQQRLGFLSPVQIVNFTTKESLTKVIQEKPALHRFPSTLAKYILGCSKYILECSSLNDRLHKKEVSKIWEDVHYDAQLIQEKLLELPGFGPKKAAMTVELLYSFLKVPIINRERSNVAADVHVIRVLSRLGVITERTQSATMEGARKLYPEEPGLLDFPLWVIGKELCKPKNPHCSQCPLEEVCLKLSV